MQKKALDLFASPEILQECRTMAFGQIRVQAPRSNQLPNIWKECRTMEFWVQI